MSTLSATNRSRQKVLGYPVDAVDLNLALKVIESAWADDKALHVVTLNAEMVVAAQDDPVLDRIIRHAHLIIPDGAGIVWAVKLTGQNIQRLPGIELAEHALRRSAFLGVKVALIGSQRQVIEKLQIDLPKIYPGLNIVFAQHGFFSLNEEEAIVEKIALCEPQLVLVALGVPRQEYFIDKWHTAFPKAITIGVGGSFDVWAGSVKRAPKLMQNLHLEWLYRLISQPWRAKRIGVNLPKFFIRVVNDLLFSSHKPEDKKDR
jgi:N-acetylglucosaminyldiphosphoundecaprenol N-acetyl-beta-D-mannosaminyltransferase